MTHARDTIGFGVPNTIDPHHVKVVIPRGREDKVRISEHFGLRSGTDGLPEHVDRVELARPKWTLIAEDVKRVFNERLKEKDLATGRWQVGDNMVERLLGKELCVLAWAVEYASAELVPVAVQNWSGLKPEERWWLFTATAAASGSVDDGQVGWRKALRYALTENPTKTTTPVAQRPTRRRKAQQESLSLFTDKGR